MPRHRPSILCSLALLLGLNLPGCKAQGSPGSAPEPTPDAGDPPAPNSADGFPAGPYADRNPALAKQLVDTGALLLDVRTTGEFRGRHIDGAVHIDHTQIAARLAEIRELQDGDLHRPIVLYCRSGHRAGLAKRELEAAGFDRVTNLGGIGDWPGT